MGKDSLNELFRQRFQGHEHPVDPGVWQAVQDQLISPTTPVEQDGVSELFKDRFQGHEHPVDPALWQQISAQLGHQVAVGAASGGIGSLGWAAAGLTAVIVAGAVYLNSSGPIAEQVAEVPVTSAVVEPLPEPEVGVPFEVVGTEKQVTGAGSTMEPSPQQTTNPAPTRTQAGPQEASPAVVVNPAEPEELPLPEEPSTPRIQEATTPIHGTQLVENIIQEMTTQVEQEVKAGSDKDRPERVQGSEQEDPERIDEEPPFTDLPVLYLPNTFTPNGDGINDTYEVGGKDFGQMLIRVFDVKNNQLVFSTNTNEPWTGANCVDGYYLVAVEAQTLDGRLVTQGKVVWLNRNPLN